MMQSMSDLLLAMLAMTTSRQVAPPGGWRKFLGVIIMVTLGSVGGIAGALITLRVNEAVLTQRVTTLETQQRDCIRDLREHEIRREPHN